MVLTMSFPRDLPQCSLTGECLFRLVPVQSTTLAGDSSPDAMGLAPSYWLCDYATTVSTRQEFGVWRAWITSLRGGLRTFKGRPNRHRWPMSHPRGFGGMTYAGGPFSGLGNLVSIGAARDTATINQLPNSLTLVEGDYFSVPFLGRQRLHTITMGGVVADNLVEVMFDPPLVPSLVPGVPVRLDAPYCDMRIVDKPSLVPKGLGGAISFTGQQVFI